jgi:hypothetical protein
VKGISNTTKKNPQNSQSSGENSNLACRKNKSPELLPVEQSIKFDVVIVVDGDNNHNNNNSIHYYLSANSHKANYRQHSVDTGNYIMVRHNIKSKTNHRQALEE